MYHALWPQNPLDDLLRDVRSATFLDSIEKTVFTVQSIVSRFVRENPHDLPTEFTMPSPDSYARRLIHADPEGRFTLMAMVWGEGQGTSLHDHDGLWVVECVYSGRVQVTNYAYHGVENGLHQFTVQSSEIGVPGVTDCRIPPFEHHTVQNASRTPSVTLHVFGGPMTRCRIYEPVFGGYLETEKTLAVTP